MQKVKTTFGRFVSDPERQKLLEREGLTFEATELISRLMQEQSVSKAQLADRLAVSRAFITQVLNGSRNLTLHTFADLVFALGHRVEFEATALNDVKDDGGCSPTYEFPDPQKRPRGQRWEYKKAAHNEHIIARPKTPDDDKAA